MFPKNLAEPSAIGPAAKLEIIKKMNKMWAHEDNGKAAEPVS